MSTPYNNKYRQIVNVFDGGLNTKVAVNQTPTNKSPDLYNVDFSDIGAIQTSKGYSKFNATAIASAPIDGIGEFVNDNNTSVLLAACGGSIHICNYGSSTFTSLSSSTSIYTSGVDVKFVTADNREFIVNGYARPYFYDGTNFRQAGPDPISFITTTSYATVNSYSTGVLSGVYRYALTGVNEWGHETDYTVISNTISVSSGEIQISNMPSFPTSAGVSTKYLYRNTAGAGTPYWRVTALTAAQTMFIDNNADTVLAIQAPSDQGTMPRVKYLVEFNGRLFGAGVSSDPTVLFYSDSGEYEKWPLLNQLFVGRSDGLHITGLYVHGNLLTIHKSDTSGKSEIYYLSADVGSSETDWVLQKSTAGKASQSDKTIVNLNSSLAFLNKSGFYSLSGDDLSVNPVDTTVSTFGVDSLSYEIEPEIKNINKSYLSKSAAIDFDNKIWLSVPDGTDTYNSLIYTFDYTTVSGKTGSWSRLEIPYANNFLNFHDSLLMGSTYDGTIYELNKDELYNYDGNAIESYYTTALLSGDEKHRYQDKVWRYALLTVECSGEWDLAVKYRTDMFEDWSVEQISLSQGVLSRWGTMIWGFDNWNSGKKIKRVRVPIHGKLSKSLQLMFMTNGIDNWFKIYEIELFYNLRRDR